MSQRLIIVVVDFITNFKASFSVYLSKHKAYEVGLSTIAKHESSQLAIFNTAIIGNPVEHLCCGHQTLNITAGINTHMHSITNAIYRADHSARHNLLDLEQRGIGTGNDITADIIKAGKPLIRVGILVRCRTIKCCAHQTSITDGAGIGSLGRLKIHDDGFAWRQRETICSAVLKWIMNMVNAVKIMISRISGFTAGERNSAIIGL
ncbi:hypothetical protein HALTITAN_2856 [Vreelandella titanicae BH1]|uniref:Uncharacterized protein n=1 Tax=Vreelandella titanicae BH1 TaxID=1204738 RepID=L9U6M5_9GAMM|nr:hypothetical protein HALTITAN_2856 [Halomonas titanicae BH1]